MAAGMRKKDIIRKNTENHLYFSTYFQDVVMVQVFFFKISHLFPKDLCHKEGPAHDW